jgi:hypothetical protein
MNYLKVPGEYTSKWHQLNIFDALESKWWNTRVKFIAVIMFDVEK